MNEDKVIQKLIEHDHQFELLRDDIQQMHRDNLDKQDEMITILKRLDEERVFTVEWIRRIENEVAEHTQAISEIKQRLKVS